MHVPDGILAPAICATTAAASLGTIGYSLRRLRQSLADRTVPLTGMMAALIFAGQMVNFPILFMSGHLTGGVLAAVILGPWGGCLAITLVLIVQCFVFSDGGLLALGANVLHMGVIGSLGGYLVYSMIRRWFSNDARGILVGAILAAWITIPAAACLLSLELGLSDLGADYDQSATLTLLVAVQSVIGIGEALITGFTIRFIQQQRPDLIYTPSTAPSRTVQLGRVMLAGVVCSMAVAAFLAPFASGLPDGLEYVAERIGFDRLAQDGQPAALADYEVPAPLAGWEESPLWQRVSVAVAGIGGTLIVVVLAFVVGRSAGLQPHVATATSDNE